MLNFSSRHDFLTSNQFQLVHFGIIDVTKLDSMSKPCTLFINIKICNMQPIQWLFWLFGSFKNGFSWILNDPAWPGTLATCCKTLSTITICNTKSIQQAKLLKMAKNLIFGLLDYSKMHFCYVWMILHDLVTLPNVKKLFVLSHYAIPSRSNNANSWKWPKTLFLALWIIQKCIFVVLEWSFMTC